MKWKRRGNKETYLAPKSRARKRYTVVRRLNYFFRRLNNRGHTTKVFRVAK